MIGIPLSTGNAKRNLVVEFTNLQFDSRTLYSRDLTAIPKTEDNAINGRQRDIINVRGFKIDMNFRGALAQDQPNILHFAIIAPLATLANDSTPVGSEDVVPDTNFFRGNSENRAIDFGTGLSSMQLHSLNINSDNYVVLKRWKKIVGEADNDNPKGPGQYKRSHTYVKLNRQVRYDTANYTENATQGRVFLVWWFDTWVGTSDGAPPIQNELLMDQHIVTYFRETA